MQLRRLYIRLILSSTCRYTLIHITSNIVTVYRYCCVSYTSSFSTCGHCVSSSDHLYLWITLWITRRGLYRVHK